MRHFHTYINVLLGNLQTEKENREETGGEAGKLENNVTQIMNELEKKAMNMPTITKKCNVEIWSNEK